MGIQYVPQHRLPVLVINVIMINDMIKKIVPLFLLVSLVACNQVEFEPMDVSGLLGEKIDSTYSIARLKKVFITDESLFSANKISYAALDSATKSRIDTTITDIVINGIVTSTDVEGNVYKYLTIQEEMPGGQAIKLSVDVSGLSAMFPLGQRVSVVCNDLYIGQYAQSVQMGVFYMNSERNRIEPGRMPKLMARKHIIPYGMPDPSAIRPDTMTIAQIRTSGHEMINKLVVIKNAFFTGNGSSSQKRPVRLTDAELIFAPSTNGIGYPQSREIQDGTGSVFVSTSEYAKFATKPIPTSNHRGHITAIVGWYNDRDLSPVASSIYHQLTIRSLNDLGKGFEAYRQSLN